MPRLLSGRVAVAAVLAIALSAAGASAVPCGDAAGTVCLGTYTYSADAEETGALCDVADNGVCEGSSKAQSCCVATTTCKGLDEGFCPWGYAALMTDPGTIEAGFTIETCCGRDGIASFPVCSTVSKGAIQAPDAADTNWAIQDGAGFVRTVGQYTGMCFSVTINNDCEFADEAVASKCCVPNKVPAFMSFKIPTATGATGEERATVLAANTFGRCKVAYGSPTASVRSLRRITRWTTVANGDDTRYVNLPLSFRRGQKQTTVCVYTHNKASNGGYDCSWEHLCGLAVAAGTPPIPDDATGFVTGCELRLIGRKSTKSSLCCSPTVSVEDFDSSAENRLASANSSSSVIELFGH
jgi:hypothetical protein